jgi:hypothetical protein
MMGGGDVKKHRRKEGMLKGKSKINENKDEIK